MAAILSRPQCVKQCTRFDATEGPKWLQLDLHVHEGSPPVQDS